MHHRMFASYGGAYNIDAVDTNSSSGSARRDSNFSGVSNSKLGILSMWLRVTSDTGNRYTLHGTDTGLGYSVISSSIRSSDLTWGVTLRRASDLAILLGKRTAANSLPASNSAWRHVITSWDLTDDAKCLMYLDDAASLLTATSAVNDTPSYTDIDFWSALAFYNSPTTNQWFQSEVADLYLNIGAWLDLSVTANRRKFISATGKPVSLGADGSAPTGAAPTLFMTIQPGGAASTFCTNRAGNGDLTQIGTLAVASTSPSD